MYGRLDEQKPTRRTPEVQQSWDAPVVPSRAHCVSDLDYLKRFNTGQAVRSCNHVTEPVECKSCETGSVTRRCTRCKVLFCGLQCSSLESTDSPGATNSTNLGFPALVTKHTKEFGSGMWIALSAPRHHQVFEEYVNSKMQSFGASASASDQGVEESVPDYRSSTISDEVLYHLSMDKIAQRAARRLESYQHRSHRRPKSQRSLSPEIEFENTDDCKPTRFQSNISKFNLGVRKVSEDTSKK